MSDKKFKLKIAEKNESGFFTSYSKDGKFISYYGDNHPQYAGNVVKAMASAKDGYPYIVDIFDDINESNRENQNVLNKEWINFKKSLDEKLIAVVHEVIRLTPTIVEVIFYAPLAAERFQPGQFYRLQNFETSAKKTKDGTPLLMEGLALTGAWQDKEKGLISIIVLEMGVSSRLCALLEKGEKVILMGPTGAPTEIHENEDVILLGGGLGNAVLFSIGKAMREKNCRVLYFAGYKKGEDLYHQSNVEASADQVIWSTDSGEVIIPNRKQDSHFRGNILQSMEAYSRGELGEKLFEIKDAKRLVVIGSDRMMAAVKNARHNALKDLFGEHTAVGSINSPMQCMMKEVCAQCLQRHVDPETGKESFVFSCYNQDQNLDNVDFDFLNSRLKANSVLEKISNLWFEKIVTTL